MRSKQSYMDVDQQNLAMVAKRLCQLLAQSNNPERDRRQVERLLWENDLWNGSIPEGLNNYRFADCLITENLLLLEAMPYLNRVWPIADLSESVEELVEKLIPPRDR